MTAVFPDTTVMCNFAAVQRVRLLEQILRGRGRWTEAVRAEVEKSRGHLPDLRRVLDGGWMGAPIVVDSDADIIAVQRIRRVVFGGDDRRPTQHLGEAETCHVISSRVEFHGAWWVTDDRAAASFGRRKGMTTLETVDLLRHAVSDGDVTAREAFDLLVKMADSKRNITVPGSWRDLTP